MKQNYNQMNFLTSTILHTMQKCGQKDKKYYNDLDLHDFFKLKIPRLFLFAKQVGKKRKRFDLSENHADPSYSSPCETDWKKREKV